MITNLIKDIGFKSIIRKNKNLYKKRLIFIDKIKNFCNNFNNNNLKLEFQKRSIYDTNDNFLTNNHIINKPEEIVIYLIKDNEKIPIINIQLNDKNYLYRFDINNNYFEQSINLSYDDHEDLFSLLKNENIWNSYKTIKINE